MKFRNLLKILSLAAAIGAAAADGGGNLIRNGTFSKPCRLPGIPHEWEVQRPNTKGGETETKLDGGSFLLYFTGPEYVDQIRIKQSLKLEPGKVYEFQYDYRSRLDAGLKADATFWGTGVFMRSWWQVPSEKWTTVRGLFAMADNVDGNVILTLQNRSRIKLWYRNIILKPTELAKEDIPKLIPEFKVHSVESDDVFILPDTKKKSADFIVNGFSDENLKKFRIEADYYPTPERMVRCRVAGRNIFVPMSAVPDGESTLIGKLYSKADNALIATAQVRLQRVMKLPAGVDFSTPAEVRLEDGRKFFPVGIYAGNGWNFSPAELVKNGFNVIHTYATNRRDVDKGDEEGRARNLKLLDDARKLGARVMVQLPHDYTEKAGESARLPHWLDVYKDHPALFGYYVDETRSIKNTPYPVIKAAYDAVRRHDPAHKWFSYEGPDPNLRDSMDAIIYGVTGPEAVKLCMLNLGPDKPVIHCYGQKDFMAQSATSLDYNQSNFVMPVIWGARGIFYFTYSNLRDRKVNPRCAELKPRVLDTARRFGEISQSIVAGDPLPKWSDTVKTTGKLEYKAFADQGACYIFCGVAADKETGGTLTFTPPAGKRLRDVLNDRPYPNTGELKLELSPGQARIIEVK